MSWLDMSMERILLYGQSKSGKTFAYCSVIEAHPESKFFLLNTDKGVQRTFQAYFGDKAEELSKRVDYTFVSSIKIIPKWIEKVRKEAKPNDWIIIDLMDAIWEMSQDEFVIQSSQAYGGDIVEYILNASKDPKKFGLFEGTKWNYIKRLDGMLSNDLVLNPPCNLLSVARQKDNAVEEIFVDNAIQKGKMDTKPEYLSVTEKIGKRPAGQKNAPYNFETIVYIGGLKEKYFIIVGDRGEYTFEGKPIKWGRNFWKTFTETRKGKGEPKPSNDIFEVSE